MAEIVIVGGGPSGAMCGEQLARSGNTVHIFDEHLAWEKPCGGGLTHKAIQRFPFLLDNPYPKKLIHSIELIASNEQRAKLEMRNPIVIYSRIVLNGLLLERAQTAGCQIHRSHVVAVDTSGEKPRYSIEGEWRTADFLVLAAGARNQLLPETRPLQKDELEITQGYFIPQPADSIIIKFLPHFDGYIWSFPRCDHLSVGICGSMASHNQTELRTHLQTFIGKQKLSIEAARFYSHVLPSPQVPTLSQRTVVGKNWTLPLSLTPSLAKVSSTPCALASSSAKPSPKATRKCTRTGFAPRFPANWNLPRASFAASIADLSSVPPSLPAWFNSCAAVRSSARSWPIFSVARRTTQRSSNALWDISV
jgi:flavin-dependent dehydrogenase